MLGLAVSACAFALPFPGGGEPYATVVHNDSQGDYIIKVTDDQGMRYYIARHASDVVVDTVGEGNLPAVTLSVLTPACALVESVSADFSQGGLLTIAADGKGTFKAFRRQRADENSGANPTCPVP
jgi:hypothetical protein